MDATYLYHLGHHDDELGIDITLGIFDSLERAMDARSDVEWEDQGICGNLRAGQNEPSG